MNKREIRFSENIEVRVKLKLECFDKELHATLKFRESMLPILEIDPLSGASFGSVKLSESENEVINCKSETYSYSLLGNEVMGDDIWPRYVVQGGVEDCVSGIEVLKKMTGSDLRNKLNTKSNVSKNGLIFGLEGTFQA